MKFLRLPMLTAVLLAVMTVVASADTKIATVDMKKLFDGYWKTKQANASLDGRKAELRKEMREMADSLDKAQADYKKLQDQANDAAISADERTKRQQAVTAKAGEITTTKTTLEQFQRQAEAQLADESQRMSRNLVGDIQGAVASKAKAGGFSLVMNSASTESVVYVDPDTDLTAAVLAQLNAGAPIDLSKPAAPATVSTNTP